MAKSEDLRSLTKLHILSSLAEFACTTTISCFMIIAAAATVTALPVRSGPYVFRIWRWKGEGLASSFRLNIFLQATVHPIYSEEVAQPLIQLPSVRIAPCVWSVMLRMKHQLSLIRIRSV